MPSFDVDIDIPHSVDISKTFPRWTKACTLQNEQITPHPCGVYPQRIASDPISKLAAIPYGEAGKLGYFKLDLLRRNVYDHFQSREEIETLLNIEPNWDLLLVKENVDNIDQLSRHFEFVKKVKPRSIETLADAIALIRPGKVNLISIYLAQPEMVRKVLYTQSDQYSFKRSHAIAYAMVIVLQLHLIELGLM